MLRILNQYCHGYVLAPVAIALEKSGFFRLLHDRSARLETIAAELKANPGPLAIAMDMLQVMGWVDLKAGRYGLAGRWTPQALPSADTLRLYAYSPAQTVSSFPGSDHLAACLNALHQQDETPCTRTILLEGPSMLSLLLGVVQTGLLNALLEGDTGKLPQAEAMQEALLRKKWAQRGDDGFALNGVGKFMFGRCLIAGVTVSYRPLLWRMHEMLFGDADEIMKAEGDREGHLDRTLNVLSSGFQHEKYFKDLSKMLAGICASESSCGPAEVADMGCGDGSLLKHLHNILTEGNQPAPTMIGVDLNKAALDVAAKTLDGIPHLLLTGDIGDPGALLETLKSRLGSSFGDILHVRSFLDHNRMYQAPQDTEAANARRALGLLDIGTGPGGTLIPPQDLFQSLVEHVARWADILQNQGLLCLEVHSMSQWGKAAYFELAEGFHFDALHAFSRQYLTSPAQFHAAMAEAGLFPEEPVLRYPKNMPYARITLAYYRRRPHRILFMDKKDLAHWNGLTLFPEAPHGQALDEAIQQSPTTCFTLIGEKGEVRAGLIVKTQQLDTKTETRNAGLIALAYDSTESALIILSHAMQSFGLLDGKTILQAPVPENILPNLAGIQNTHCVWEPMACS